jgi:integrase
MRGIYDRFCVKLGQRPLHLIEDEELEAWRDSCRDLSLRTLRNYFNYLAIVFQRGIRKGWCKENPAAGIKAEILELPRDVTILTANEMARLLGAALSLRKELVAPLALKAFAGIRTSELLRLTWGEIKNSAVHIERRKAKTKRARHITHQIPLPAWLKAVKLAEKTGSSFVVQMQEKPFHQGVAVLAKAAGIKVRSNALRHSFGTYYYHKHKNAPQTAYLMGNSVGVVERDYLHYAPDEKDIALWWRITPALARKAYASHLKSPSSGGKVARKKRTSKARIHFVPSEKDKTQEKATGRKPRKPAAKKRRL